MTNNEPDHPSTKQHKRLAGLAEVLGRKQYEVLEEALDLFVARLRRELFDSSPSASDAERHQPQTPAPAPSNFEKPGKQLELVLTSKGTLEAKRRRKVCPHCKRDCDVRGINNHINYCHSNPNKRTGRPPQFKEYYAALEDYKANGSDGIPPHHNKCPVCKAVILSRNMPRHMRTIHPYHNADEPIENEPQEQPNGPEVELPPGYSRCEFCKKLIQTRRLKRHYRKCKVKKAVDSNDPMATQELLVDIGGEVLHFPSAFEAKRQLLLRGYAPTTIGRAIKAGLDALQQ